MGYKYGGRFQFLIGRLKTRTCGRMSFWQDGFQFLIGRLKTEFRNNEEMHSDLFQFLIGRLKTMLEYLQPVYLQ